MFFVEKVLFYRHSFLIINAKNFVIINDVFLDGFLRNLIAQEQVKRAFLFTFLIEGKPFSGNKQQTQPG